MSWLLIFPVLTSIGLLISTLNMNKLIDAMEDFGKPIHTTKEGVEFRIRKSTGSVFTHHPRTEEWVYLCKLQSWPDVAKKFGLRVVAKSKKKKEDEPKAS